MARTTAPTRTSSPSLRLRALLIERDISISDLAAAVSHERTGPALSRSTLSRIVNYAAWPDWAARERPLLQQQIEQHLQGLGVPLAALADCWVPDDSPPIHPRADAGEKKGALLPQRPTFQSTPAVSSGRNLPEKTMLSQAARKQFGLFRDPFTDDVTGPEDVFMTGDQRYIREALYQTSQHGGLLAVVGESGAGKSVLRRDLLDRIRREGAQIVPIQPRAIDKARLNASQICDAVLADSGAAACNGNLENKARRIEKQLAAGVRSGTRYVLLIEEAHDLTITILKFLKRFWEMEDGFQRLLSIVLIGQPELKAKLDESQHPEARELIRRCEVAELLPLDGAVGDYLAMKFRRLGVDPVVVLAADAPDAIRERLTLRSRNGHGTGGARSMVYPLIVNNLTVKALNLAAELSAPHVSRDVILAVR